jgi:hypothetical protein
VPIREPSERRSRRSNPRIAHTTVYSDDELRHMYEHMVRTKRAPDAAAVAPMRGWVESQMRAAAIETRYDVAAKLEEADAMLEGFLCHDDGPLVQERRRKAAAEKLAVMKEKVRVTNEQWTQKIEAWHADQARRLNALEYSHDQQLAEFERRWADPACLMQFSKPSGRALSLRQVEVGLAMAKNFRDAQIVKRSADRLEHQEAVAARQRAIASVRTEYETLQVRQKKEIECFQEFTKRVTSVMEMDRDREIAPIKMVCERLVTVINRPPAEPKKVVTRSSPRPLHGIKSTRPRALPLAGIQVRQHIRIKK